MHKNGSFTVLSGVAAALIALTAITATSSSLHAAGDDGGPKQVACSYLGCPGSKDVCADITGKVSIPGVGEVSVTYHCKEGGDEM